MVEDTQAWKKDRRIPNTLSHHPAARIREGGWDKEKTSEEIAEPMLWSIGVWCLKHHEGLQQPAILSCCATAILLLWMLRQVALWQSKIVHLIPRICRSPCHALTLFAKPRELDVASRCGSAARRICLDSSGPSSTSCKTGRSLSGLRHRHWPVQ